MKLGNKEINLIKVLIGIALAVLVWMFVASPIRDKKDALAAENAELKVKKEEYEAVNAQKKKYEEGMTKLQLERESLLAAFPSGMIREDEIMYWANMERANSGFESSNEEGATQLHLYKAPVNYTFKSTYDGLKGMADYVFAQNDKKSIEGVVASFDAETGNLVGTLDMNMYYMVGTGKEHTPATIPTVPTGVSNLFRAGNTRVITDADVEAGYVPASDEE